MDDTCIEITLSPDEMAMLYRGYVQGMPGGNPSVHQGLTMKLEIARMRAQGVLALASSKAIDRSKSRGKKAGIV